MNFTKMATEQLNNERMNTEELYVGKTIKAIGKGAFAECIPPVEYVVSKVNKKTVKTECGKTIEKNRIR